jgi:glycolate oxidase
VSPTSVPSPDLTAALVGIVGVADVLTGGAISDDHTHDEALTGAPGRPGWVVRPATAEQVAAVVDLASSHGVPLTARGAGTGLSGACTPADGGLVVSFERMDAIVEIDPVDHVAVVQPGVTLARLDAALAPYGLVYPVFPGESSASLGGNVATNAGGLRAVKYGVTRHHVLGLQAVLGTGEVIRTGGRFVKATSGYDLTQLVIGSEGTLALVTEATLRLHPRPGHAATILAPFATLAGVTAAVAPIVQSGVGPLILEYIDLVSMAGILDAADLDFGVPAAVKDRALAYLVIVVEDRSATRLDEDVADLAELVAGLDALDVYVLPPAAGTALIAARERSFWAAKAAGANDIVDVVVPRSQIDPYIAAVHADAQATGSLIVACGHVGDGNVHLAVFQPDDEVRARLLHGIIKAGVDRGGAISGEHGIGTEKRTYLAELEDPAKLALMRRIKAAFDPSGILNPHVLLDAPSTGVPPGGPA